MKSRLWRGDDPELDGRKAFGGLLAGELAALRRYAIGLAGEVSMADDLVQSTLERAWERRHALQDTGKLRPWLRAILTNLHTDDRRRRVRQRCEAIEDAGVENSLAHAVLPSTPATLDVTSALRRLSDDHRAILLLIAVEQLSYAEAAEALEVPIGTVMSRLARARQALRTLLDGRSERPGKDGGKR